MSWEKESRAMYRKADKENLHLLHKSFLPNSQQDKSWKDGKSTSKGTVTALAVSLIHICKSCYFPSETKIAGIPPFLVTHAEQPQWRFPGQKRNVPPENHFQGLDTQHEWAYGRSHLTPPGEDWGDDWAKVSPKPEWRWPGHDEVHPKSLCSPWVDDSHQEDSADSRHCQKSCHKKQTLTPLLEAWPKLTLR